MKTRSILFGATPVILAGIAAGFYFANNSTAPKDTALPVKIVAEKKARLPLHPVVERMVSGRGSIPYLKFNYLIKELPLDLAPHDLDALIGFISGPRPPEFSEAGWGSIVNDTEEILTVQTVPSGAVADALIAIHRDESKIQMQRDYALQHIGGFAIYLVHAKSAEDRGLTGTDESISPIFPRLLSELKQAASQASKPWSGTALNLLDGVLRAGEYCQLTIPGLNAENIVDLAIPVARDQSAPLNARLPALLAAARRESPEALPLAREILLNPDSNLMLIQSASATFARLGTTDDLPLLRTASEVATRHTSTAINNAITSIQNRFASN